MSKEQQEEKLFVRCPNSENCSIRCLYYPHCKPHKKEDDCNNPEGKREILGFICPACIPVEPESKPEVKPIKCPECESENIVYLDKGSQVAKCKQCGYQFTKKPEVKIEVFKKDSETLSILGDKPVKQPEQEKCRYLAEGCVGHCPDNINNCIAIKMMKGTGLKPSEKRVDLLEGTGSPPIGDQKKPKEEPMNEGLFMNLRNILCNGTTDCENYPECPIEDYCLVEKIIKDVIPLLRQSISREVVGEVVKDMTILNHNITGIRDNLNTLEFAIKVSYRFRKKYEQKLKEIK